MHIVPNHAPMALQDQLGRSFKYLRLSLTDACNFRCQYCLPFGYTRNAPSGDPMRDAPLSRSEISALVRGFAALGFTKVRLTGGEPTLRQDILQIVDDIAAVPGIETVALTTNGYRFSSIAKQLRDAGLSAVNISVDSLDRVRFEEITRSKRFDQVLQGVESALALGYSKVKINVVLLRGHIEHDIGSFLDFIREKNISVRFIELMQTGDNVEFFKKHYLQGTEFMGILEEQGWSRIPRSSNDGPAVELACEGFIGRMGIIAPYSKDFCSGCNRLRVSSRGALKLCLFGDGEYSLRKHLQQTSSQEELTHAVRNVLGLKPEAHRLREGNSGTTRHLASIGG